MIIRTATVEDAKRLLEIYSYYVEETAVSFELVPPTSEEFASRIENTLTKYPYLVLEDEGRIMGYTYAGAFRNRAAYAHTCELSVYVDNSARGNGYGRKLYETISDELKAMGYLNLYAFVASPVEEDEYLNRNSEYFHQKLGFHKSGEFYKCGHKFGRWYNMLCMEKIIGEHE